MTNTPFVSILYNSVIYKGLVAEKCRLTYIRLVFQWILLQVVSGIPSRFLISCVLQMEDYEMMRKGRLDTYLNY